ncbi:hypothetical protein [Asticcacaulis sp.]|uniref:hypothetical protein n=1 Tax=Asticcacaulis sp. TaxID=1872648 RepID=UPI00262CE6D3|nr:hypothetical protein [Asticcacaulis sp.]
MENIPAGQAISVLLLGVLTCSFWQRNSPRSWINLAVAISLVVLACSFAYVQLDLPTLFDRLASFNQISSDVAAIGKLQAGFWAGVVSLVVGGVGVNLLSSWIDS